MLYEEGNALPLLDPKDTHYKTAEYEHNSVYKIPTFTRKLHSVPLVVMKAVLHEPYVQKAQVTAVSK